MFFSEEEGIEVILSVRELSKSMFDITNKDCERIGITVAQAWVLGLISSSPGLSLDQVAEQLFSAKSTMSGIVDRLVKSELLLRERSPKDRRAYTLKVTPLGDAKLQELIQHPDSEFFLRMNRVLAEHREQIKQMLITHQLIINAMRE